jgi:hypothetical protein
MSVKLAPGSAGPAKGSAALGGRPIPWDSPAKFLEMGNGVQLSCSLRDCVAAFAALGVERRQMAIIISNELVPTAHGGAAALMLDPADIAQLVEALPAK